MATWVSHFRLAENLLNHGFKLDQTHFTVGNIAPDSGIPDENGQFNPPTQITHFGSEGIHVNPDTFYKQHVEGQAFSDAQYAFMIGYYAHLLADVAWAEIIYRPKKITPLWAQGLVGNPDFIWEIKKDWYGLDFIFLNNNPNSLFYSTFTQIDSVPDYLEFIPDGNLTKTVKRIQDYYNSDENMQSSLAHEYHYLTKPEIDTYIEQTTQRLITAFDAIDIPQY